MLGILKEAIHAIMNDPAICFLAGCMSILLDSFWELIHKKKNKKEKEDIDFNFFKFAKDMAFDKEREKYRHEIGELQYQISKKEAEIKNLNNLIETKESKIEELDDWIHRLLEYTELSEEDMKRFMEKERKTAEKIENFYSIQQVSNRFI
ncbi:hypothetical protein AALB81_16455 [Lachnospiraceae bacterium 48-33]